MYLEAALVARQGSLWVKVVRSLTTLAVGMLTFDLEAGPSVIDLQVTRRDTGNEVLRVSAGTVAEADRLLLQVRHALDNKSVADFVLDWRLAHPGNPDRL